MVRIIKKRAYLLVGILISSLFGTLGSIVRSQYSKADSWFIPSARADIQPYTWVPGACGDGCGGCSGGDSGS
ncbi:MAG: hypothetical protein WAT81_04650 [Candidatus Moraniibacteriota bacterium]